MDDTALALSIMGVLMICLMLFWHQRYTDIVELRLIFL